MDLETYRRKRNFRKTPEPRGRAERRTEKRLRFVVQKHAARSLHYDFRLEMNGALASWAVPKGPSLNPKERRLAVQVEDHPIEYGAFEGTIPEGEYGAGTVLLWDRGSWTPEGDPIEGRRKGKLKFHLKGKKLRGGWILVRMKGERQPKGKNWLLIKERDEDAGRGDVERMRPASVKSGRKIGEMSRNDESGGAKSERRRTELKKPEQIEGAKKSKLPDFYQPELATLVDTVPQGDDWLHEIKFDGYRILCRIDGGEISLLTREAHNWTRRFQSIADAAKELPARQALLDGEIAALEKDGTTNFQVLQNSLRQNTTEDLVYFVFDLLYLDGYDLSRASLLSRKKLLEKLLNARPGARDRQTLRYSEHWVGQGDSLLQKACAVGLEGIVAKRIDRPHLSGRSRNWLKIKCVKSQEFVISGFTDPAGSRAGLGALLLGVYDDEQRLHYAGRVGTGFTEETLFDIHARLDKLTQKTPPFINPPRGRHARGVHWVKPDLVGEVAFTGWTKDNVLRHPSFKGLREDKPAGQIQREKPASTPKMVSSNDTSNSPGEIAGIKLTHPDRVLYPDQGITKLDLAQYYAKIADWIMPHIEGRPLTLVRCPEGHKKQCFYQRHTNEHLDPAIVPIRVKEKKSVASYVSVDSLSGIIALVQMGVLELHTWGARKERIEQPDQLIFDLDPDPTVSWNSLKEAALTLRERLSNLGLSVFLKTTGGKGLHVVVPIAPNHDWAFAKEFTKSVAQSIVRENPDRYTATMSKVKRKGKIFIDYLRNAKAATAVCVYSTRARSGAPVSLPVRWQELTEDIREKFTIQTVPKRLARMKKNPWEDYEAARGSITAKMMKQL